MNNTSVLIPQSIGPTVRIDQCCLTLKTKANGATVDRVVITITLPLKFNILSQRNKTHHVAVLLGVGVRRLQLAIKLKLPTFMLLAMINYGICQTP